MRMKYRLVVFDMDGTILDTLSDLTDALNHTLDIYGLPLHSMDEVKFFVGNGIHKLIERAVPEGTEQKKLEEIFKSYIEYYGKHCADKTKPYEGVKDLIMELKKLGVLTAVVSNKRDEAVQELCRDYFPGCFDIAIGEKDGIRRKPAPDMVDQALLKLGIDKKDAVYIGDSDVDIQTAENSGLSSIAVTWGFRDRDFLIAHGAEVFADEPYDIIKIIM